MDLAPSTREVRARNTKSAKMQVRKLNIKIGLNSLGIMGVEGESGQYIIGPD
jgi:hypothetical protein